MTRDLPPDKSLHDRITFAESGARWYDQHGQPAMARWSREEAERWREKLRCQQEIQEADAFPTDTQAKES